MYNRPICGRSTGTYTNLGDLQRDLMGVKSHPTKKKKTYLAAFPCSICVSSNNATFVINKFINTKPNKYLIIIPGDMQHMFSVNSIVPPLPYCSSHNFTITYAIHPKITEPNSCFMLKQHEFLISSLGYTHFGYAVCNIFHVPVNR
jgi:hypothetical protein